MEHDERAEEVEALEAIFGDEFQLRASESVRGKRKGGGGVVLVFDVIVSPYEGEDERNWVSVVATFRLGPKYPAKEAAKVSVSGRGEGPRGMYGPSEPRIQEVREFASKKAGNLVGRVHVYEVVNAIRDKLVEWNVPPLALRDEMLKRQKEMAEKERREAEATRRNEERALERAQENAKKIAEEETRLRELEVRATHERNIRKKMVLSSAPYQVSGDGSLGSARDDDLLDDLRVVLEDFNRTRHLPNSESKNQIERQRSRGVAINREAGNFQLPLQDLGLGRSPAQNVHSDWDTSADESPEDDTHYLDASSEEEENEDDRDAAYASSALESRGECPSRLTIHTNDHTVLSSSRSSSSLSLSTSPVEKIFAGRAESWQKIQSSMKVSPTMDGMSTVSRFRSDFEVVRKLGEGGFGSVVKARNRLDGRDYAVKRIRLFKEDLEDRNVVREVLTLSRLMHPNIVRYFQAWLELPDLTSGQVDVFEDDEVSSGLSSRRTTMVTPTPTANTEETSEREVMAYMYIQMEYCRSTLRVFIDFADDSDQDLWAIFRQIVEALAYLHSKGIVHRDLKPTNIFFSTGGDIKVGDFGLAKSIAQSSNSSATIPEADSGISNQPVRAMSLELTGAVGTVHYRAPEVEEAGRLAYSDKVDVYSLGIIAWELWHGPCSTQMERTELLTKLRESGGPDANFERLNPRQTRLIRTLLAKNPSTRPSAAELLDSDLLPPREEDQYTRSILRQLGAPGSRLRAQALEILFSQDVTGVEEAQLNAVTLQLLLSQGAEWGHFSLTSGGNVMAPDHFSATSASSGRPGRQKRPDFELGQLREHIMDCARTVFRSHGARPTTCAPMGPDLSFGWDTSSRALSTSGGRPPIANAAGPSSGRTGYGTPMVYLSRLGNRVVLTQDARQMYAQKVVTTGYFGKRYEVGMVWEGEASLPSVGPKSASSGSVSGAGIPKSGSKQFLHSASPSQLAVDMEKAQKCVLFADFDILLAKRSPLAIAEVMKGALEVTAALPLIGRTYVRLGNGSLSRAVLRFCCRGEKKNHRKDGVPFDVIAQGIEHAMSYLPYVGWNATRKVLKTDLGLSSATVDKMKQFVALKGPPATILRQTVSLLASAHLDAKLKPFRLSGYEELIQQRKNGGFWNQTAEMTDDDKKPKNGQEQMTAEVAEAVDDLTTILSLLESMLVATDEVVLLDPLLCRPGQAGRGGLNDGLSRKQWLYEDMLYFDGVVYELFVRHSKEARGSGIVTDCIGWGGDWNDLLQRASRFYKRIGAQLAAGPQPYAVGATLNLEKIFQMISRTGIDEFATQCDVFVSSSKGDFRSSLVDRIGLASQLWSMGIRTDLLHEEYPAPHAEQRAALELGAKWMISVRRHRTNAAPLVRVKSLTNRRIEEDIPLPEVPKFLSLGKSK